MLLTIRIPLGSFVIFGIQKTNVSHIAKLIIGIQKKNANFEKILERILRQDGYGTARAGRQTPDGLG